MGFAARKRLAPGLSPLCDIFSGPQSNALLCPAIVAHRLLSVLRGRRPHPLPAGVLAALIGLLSVSAVAGGVHEYLDEDTGATVTLMTQPLVFAYARTDLAANARDYATLQAAAVNRSGKVDYVLIAYFWSTVDPRLRQEALPNPQQLLLQADDRLIRLGLRAHTAREAGIGMIVDPPPGSSSTPNVYATDLDTLRFIAASRRVALVIDTEPSTLTYDLWEDRRPALRSFVQHLQGQD